MYINLIDIWFKDSAVPFALGTTFYIESIGVYKQKLRKMFLKCFQQHNDCFKSLWNQNWQFFIL